MRRGHSIASAADLFICWVRKQVTLQPRRWRAPGRRGPSFAGSGPRHAPSPGAGGRRGHRCRETDAVRESRSIIFYAWAGLAVQSVLTAAVIAFVLAGAAYQRSAIEQLRGKVQAIQVVNLAMVADFLDAQRAVAGYQATGQAGLLQGYRAERGEFDKELADLGRLAWPTPKGDLLAEGRTARSAFLADDRAGAAPRGSAAAARFYTTAQSTP